MSSASRRGLGRGLGSLIPTAPPSRPETEDRPEQPMNGSTASPPSGGPDGADAREGGEPVPGHSGGPGAEDLEDSRETGLFGGGRSPDTGAFFAELPVAEVVPNPRQPRQVFDEEAMAELVHSVREIGLLQPVVVRPARGAADPAAYELIMGERRWRAVREAGLETIPAIVRESGDDAMLRDALLENLHRAQLNPLEEAAAYQQLLDDFGCTHDELADRIGRSRPQISNTLRLLRLSPEVQRRVAAGVLSAGHARALLGVAEPGAQDRLAARAVAEGISVRGLEELVTVGEDAGGGRPGRSPRRSQPNAPGLSEISERLSDRLETRVKVDLGRSKGKIVVEFASLEDLDRILGMIDPGGGPDGGPGGGAEGGSDGGYGDAPAAATSSEIHS